MKEKEKNTNQAAPPTAKHEQPGEQGYPEYPASEDIYSRYHEEKDIDPEDVSQRKNLNDIDPVKSNRELSPVHEIHSFDLDIPGSELDDKLEDIGSEDEENNYYSIGGDGHDSLDEDKA